MRRLAAAALALVACTAAGGGSTTSSVTTATTFPPATTTTPGTTVPGTTGCAEGTPMVSEGTVLDTEPEDTDTGAIGELDWTVGDGCERFRVEFETAEGAPATTPPRLAIELLPGGRILRINVEAGATVITDQLVETPLVRRLFVARSLAGGLFVDLHLAEPVRARAEIARSPAQLRLEIEPSRRRAAPPPAVGDRIVVISPRSAAEVATTVTVSGYARTFEGNVLVRASVGNEVFSTATTVAADWAETWGEFQVPILVPTGEVSLFVGGEDPRDGSLQGVTLSLTVR